LTLFWNARRPGQVENAIRTICRRQIPLFDSAMAFIAPGSGGSVIRNSLPAGLSGHWSPARPLE